MWIWHALSQWPFPGIFRNKKRSQLVAAYLACQSVAGVGVFLRHIWHKTTFIPTCVKSHLLPVNKARWRNHVTHLRWVRYSWSHSSASRDGSSSQCDRPSRMMTRQGSAAQVPDSAKDDGSSRRVTSQQGGTTRQRVRSQGSWTTQQAWLTQHMMMMTQQALLTQHMMMTTQQALLTQHMMMTTQQALLTQLMMMTTREVWSTHHTIRIWQWTAQLRYMLWKRSFNFLPSVWATGRSKRAMTTTSSGSKATEVEQSAVRPSRSCQPKVVQVQESHDNHKFGVEGYGGGAICRPAYQVPSTQEVRGFQRVYGGTAQLRRVRTPQITKWVSQARGDEPVVQGTPAGNTPAAR